MNVELARTQQEPMTQEAVAKLMGVSRRRITQIEQRAIRKLKRAVEREAAAAGTTVRDWLFGDGGR